MRREISRWWTFSFQKFSFDQSLIFRFHRTLKIENSNSDFIAIDGKWPPRRTCRSTVLNRLSFITFFTVTHTHSNLRTHTRTRVITLDNLLKIHLTTTTFWASGSSVFKMLWISTSQVTSRLYTAAPQSLFELCFGVLLKNVPNISPVELSSLPEHVLLELFDGILVRGMLNEQTLELFVKASVTTKTLEERIRSFNFYSLPPRQRIIRDRWWGEPTHWRVRTRQRFFKLFITM